MTLRTIQGYVQLPAEPVTAQWGAATVELRDVSQMDEPSRVIASVTLPRIRLTPGSDSIFRSMPGHRSRNIRSTCVLNCRARSPMHGRAPLCI